MARARTSGVGPPHLGLDLLLVVLDDDELVTLALLLDGGHDAPRSAAGADDVLVGDGEEVALCVVCVCVCGGGGK